MGLETKRVWAGGLAAGLAGVAASDCNANIDYTPVDQQVNVNNQAVDLDFLNNGSPALSIDYFSTNGLVLNKQTYNTNPEYVTPESSSGIVAALPSGETIGPSSTFDTENFNGDNGNSDGAELNNADGTTGQFFPTDPSTQYIGVEFATATADYPDVPPIPTDYVYGWIGIQVTDDSSLSDLSATVTGFAYDDTGGPINAGDVPEPAPLALLAMGAIGLLAYRRRSPIRS